MNHDRRDSLSFLFFSSLSFPPPPPFFFLPWNDVVRPDPVATRRDSERKIDLLVVQTHFPSSLESKKGCAASFLNRNGVRLRVSFARIFSREDVAASVSIKKRDCRIVYG